MTKRRGNKEGSIWRDKNKWRAAVTLDNQRITRNFNSKAECKAWIRETQNQITQGMTYNSTSITLGKFLEQWFDIHKTQLAPRTALRYEQLIRDYLLPQLGVVKLGSLKLCKVETHYQYLLDQGLGARSVRFVHSILHKSLNDAVRRGYLGYNPANGARLPRYDAPEMAILDEDEVIRLLIAVQGSRQEALYILAIKTGMRLGELLGLKWFDIDWRKGTVRVQRQVQRIHKQGIVFKPPKTRSGLRTIQLGEHTLQILRGQYEQCQRDVSIVGEDRWQDIDLIFPSKVGTPLEGTTVLKDFKEHL